MKDLKANGIVTCGGGTYAQVDLQGVVNVSDSVTCETFKIEGVGKIKGDLEASSAKISGTCKITGDLKADSMDIYGVLSLSGNLTGDHVAVDGALDVEGEINADNFSLLMSHGSAAKEVLGQSCTVKKGKGSAWLGVLRARKHEFSCQNIECDDINLEHSNVQHVSGQRVSIGPKCTIGTLEYSEEYSVHKTSKVEKNIKRGEGV